MIIGLIMMVGCPRVFGSVMNKVLPDPSQEITGYIPEARYFEIRCLNCKRLGLLSNGLCKHGCGAVHLVTVEP